MEASVVTTPTPRWTAETTELVYREIGYFLIQEGALSRLDDFAEHILTALADAGVLTAVGGNEGICGAEATAIIGTALLDVCVLRHGHASDWHEADNGMRWKPRRDALIEAHDRGFRDAIDVLRAVPTVWAPLAADVLDEALKVAATGAGGHR